MIRKLFQISAILLIVASWAPTFHANVNGPQIQHGPLSPKVFLKCTLEVESSKVGSQDIVTFAITIKNTTSATIPKDSTIQWSVNASTEGHNKLQTALPPGASVRTPVLVHGSCPYKPQAWHYESPQSSAIGPPIQTLPSTVIELQCSLKLEAQGPTMSFVMTIKNTTSATIPKDTTIYWSLDASSKGSFKLPHALSPGASVNKNLQSMPPSGPIPKAWYNKL